MKTKHAELFVLFIFFPYLFSYTSQTSLPYFYIPSLTRDKKNAGCILIYRYEYLFCKKLDKPVSTRKLLQITYLDIIEYHKLDICSCKSCVQLCSKCNSDLK